MATEILRGLEASPDPGLLEVDPGQWYDPQTSYTKLMAHEEAFVLRNKLDELARHVANRDLVVMTLGLTETLFDTSSQVAFNGLNVVSNLPRRATTGHFNATVAQVSKFLST